MKTARTVGLLVLFSLVGGFIGKALPGEGWYPEGWIGRMGDFRTGQVLRSGAGVIGRQLMGNLELSDGFLSFGAPQEITMGAGITEIAPTRSIVRVTAQAGGNTLTTISLANAPQGALLWLFKGGGGTITVTDSGPTASGGQINTHGGFSLVNERGILLYLYETRWVHIGGAG